MRAKSPLVYLLLAGLSLGTSLVIASLVVFPELRENLERRKAMERAVLFAEPGETGREAPGSQAAEVATPVRAPRVTKAAQPVPESVAVDSARQALQHRLGDAYRNAQQPAQKARLAADLLKQAQTVQANDAAKYVLLRDATDLAAAGGDWDAAFAAIAQLEQNYGVDGWELRQQLLGTKVDASQLDPSQLEQETVKMAAQQLEAAVAAGEHEAAGRLTDMLQSSVSRLRDPALRKTVQAHVRKVQKMQESWNTDTTSTGQSARSKSRTQPRTPPRSGGSSMQTGDYVLPSGSLRKSLGAWIRGSDRAFESDPTARSRHVADRIEREGTPGDVLLDFWNVPLEMPPGTKRSNGVGDRTEPSATPVQRSIHLTGSQAVNEELVAISKESGVGSITLENTRVDGTGLKALCSMVTLTTLTIRQGTLRDDDLSPLTSLRGLANVALEDVPLSGEGLRHLSAVQHLTLRKVPLTPTGLKELLRLPRLHVLELSQVPLHGMEWQGLRRATRLTALHLSDLKFGDSELFVFHDLTGLRELSLRNVQVTAEGLADGKPPALRTLTLDRERFSAVDLERLHRALPRCQIHRW